MDFAREIRAVEGLTEKLSLLRTNPLAETPLLFAKVKLLWQCNLSCSYCVRPQNTSPMPKQTLLQLLSELRAKGLKKVHFSGGEVFLHPEIKQILRDTSGLGLQVNLTTNGTLLDRENLKLLADYGVHSVSISLDSADASLHDKIRGKKGAFKATMKAIKTLAAGRKYPKLRINTVVTPKNAAGLDEMSGLIKGLGSSVQWKIIPVDPVPGTSLPGEKLLAALAAKAACWMQLDEENPFGRSREDFRAFAKGAYGYSRTRCYMPWLHLFVEPSGFCYPCCMSRGKIKALGRYPQEGVEQILFGKNSAEIKMSMAGGIMPGSCAGCDDFQKECSEVDRLLNRP